MRATGEFGAGLCGNVADDDGDGLWDCDDPDCWATETCNGASQVTVAQLDAGLSAFPSDAGYGADADMTEPADMLDEDSGAPEPDAVLTPPSGCDVPDGPKCTADEVCAEGVCVRDRFEDGVYLVRVTSAFLPLKDKNGACFESLFDGCTAVLTCNGCLPDPYVIIELNGDEIARTSIDTDAIAPAWHDAPFEVSTAPARTLTLRVMDDDVAPMQDALIFSCQVDLEVLGTAGGVQCVPAAADTAAGMYQVSLDVSPKPRTD